VTLDTRHEDEPVGLGGRKLRQLADLSVSVLKGVGAAATRDLSELGVDTVLDLLTHYPRRYIDGTRLVPIADLTPGDKTSILGEVTRVSRPPSGYGRGRRRSPSRVIIQISDGSARIDVVFFNQAWRAKQLAVGTVALLYGTVGVYRGARQLNSPTAEVIRAAGEGTESEDGSRSGRIYPVYPLTDKANLTSAQIGRYVGEALDRAARMADPLLEAWRHRFDLVDRTAAFN
jgi:ATP-dependent DNA helicase RecG